MGVAREAAAILPRFNHPAKFLPPKIKKLALPKSSLPLKVTIDPPSICPRFTAVVLDHLKIKPSPKLICDRLEKSGLRALNNIVDISNYLMLETGQPIHTFDYDKIANHVMKLRLSRKGEKVVTLDGVTRTLPGGDIVIEDGAKRLIDLCGIMGAENSAIDQNTQRVLFFVQSYDPVLIRRTSMLLAHRTEAAIRFERGVDEEGIETVIWQGLKLAHDLAGAIPASKIYDLYPHPFTGKTIKTSLARVTRKLGVEISPREIIEILGSLEIKTEIKKEKLTARIPSWRQDDLNLAEDLTEEVARIYGYHNLPSLIPPVRVAPYSRGQKLVWEQKIKEYLKHQGFTEIYNYSMISQKLLDLCPPRPKAVKISNPLTEEWVYMRPQLLPSLFANLQHNQDHFSQIKLFEMANVYSGKGKTSPVNEQLRLAGVIGHQNFSQIKGLVEALLDELEINGATVDFASEPNPFFDPQKQAVLKIKNSPLGCLGEINPLLKKQLSLKENYALFDLQVDPLTQAAGWHKSFVPTPAFPPVIEDLSFVIPPQTSAASLLTAIHQSHPLVADVQLISVYHQTYTFRVTYQDARKTLTDQEAGQIRKKILADLHQKLRAELKK